MKLLSNEDIKGLKQAIKDAKSQIIFALIIITIMNLCSGYVTKKHEKVKRKAEQLIASCQEIDRDPYDDVNLLSDEDDEETEENENNDTNENNNVVVRSINAIRKKYDPNGMIDIKDEEMRLIAEKMMRYLSYADDSVAKKEFLEAIVNDSFKELINTKMVNIEKDEEVLVEEESDEEITLDNFDTVSLEKKIAFICEKYDLTDYEFKVVFSVLYYEAGWHYDDAFKVTTVFYNRINSKESIRYIHYLTKNVTEHGGDSLYSQVIATNYTKDGKKVQQFDGYISGVAGYDFDELLKKDNIDVKLDAFLDCLILLKLGEEYENPAFPLAPCFAKTSFWGDGKRNHFSNSIDTSDAVEGYNYPYTEYDKEFTREEVIEMAKEYMVSAKKRVK